MNAFDAAYAAAFALVAIAVWRVRAHRRPAPGPVVPAADDNGPGIDFEAQYKCEFWFAMPDYNPATDPDLEPGFDRLRAAIRDEQQKKEGEE